MSNPLPEPSARWPIGRIALLLVPLFLLYAYPLGFAPGWIGANQSAHGFLALSLYEHGETSIDRVIQDYFRSQDFVYRDGRFYSNKPPGPALLLVPVAALLAAATGERPELLPLIYVGRLLVLTLPFVLFLIWIGRTLERFVAPAVAWGLVIAYALGTSAAAYASLYFSHQFAAMGLVAGFLLILRGGAWRLLAGGLACGFAVLCEYQVVVIALILTVFAASARRDGTADGTPGDPPLERERPRLDLASAALFVLGAVPMAIVLLYYNAHAFGSPAEVSYQAEFEHFELPQASLGFTAPSPTKLMLLMFSPALGLFFYSPWLIAAVVAAVASFRRRDPRRRALLAATIAGFALPIVISAHGYWVGGAIAGPRYLAAGVPFLLFPIAAALGAAKAAHRRGITVAMIVAGLVSIGLFASLLLVGPFVNTDADYLAQNPFASVVWPMLSSGLSAFTLASAWGASSTVSVTIHIVLVLLVVVPYAGFAITAHRSFAKPIAAGLALGVLCFAVWTRIGSKETPIAERHVAHARRYYAQENLPRDEKGLLYLGRPEAIDPTSMALDVREVHGGLRDIVPEGTVVTKLAHRFAGLQSMLWHPDGYLLCADPVKNTIYKFTPGGSLDVFAERTGYHGRYVAALTKPGANGLTFAPDGALVAAGGSRRAVFRVGEGNDIRVLAHRFEGKQLNSPQNVHHRSDGTLYFTDPPFSLPRTFDDPMRELPFSGLFSVQGDRLRLESDRLRAPTGLALSANERTLWVGEWKNDTKSLWAFDVATDGRLRNGREKFVMRPGESTIPSDGLVLDERGNIYLTGDGGIRILSRRGRPLGFVRTPWPIWSLAWGDPDRKSLYLAGGTVLLRLRMGIAGPAPRGAAKSKPTPAR